MSNKTIEEQRRAREERINTLKAKQGLIEPEINDQAAVIIPQTPKEKAQNFWYHFKWHTMGLIALIAVIAIMVVQCATREKYDFITVVYTHTAIPDVRTEEIEKYLEQYAEDIDGDGKVSVEVVNCSFDGTLSNSQTVQAAISKMQAMVASEPKALLFIVDTKGLNEVESWSENEFFEKEPILLGEDFYITCNGKESYEKLPDDLKIGYRKLNDTLFEKNDTAKKIYKVCEKVYEELAKKK